MIHPDKPTAPILAAVALALAGAPQASCAAPSGETSAQACSIGSVHRMMEAVFPIAKRHLSKPALYSIRQESDFHYAGATGRHWEFVFIDPGSQRRISILHPVSPDRPTAYSVMIPVSIRSGTVEEREQMWISLPGGEWTGPMEGRSRSRAPAPCAPLSSDFIDSLEMKARLERIGFDVCGPSPQPGAIKFECALFHPLSGNFATSRCLGYTLYDETLHYVWGSYPKAIANRDIWGCEDGAKEEVAFLDARTGKLLFRGPGKYFRIPSGTVIPESP